LLEKIALQNGNFTVSIVVVDNDKAQSARLTVDTFASSCPIPITYACEPRQNIALARNRAVKEASGEFIAFFDDDQIPSENWLQSLLSLCEKTGTDGVLGPVKPIFEVKPPDWVTKGGFYDRASYPTGFKIGWRQGRTGNVLLRRSILEGETEPFRAAFLTGEDQDFFRRMIDKGFKFVWCNEALAYEVVPALRWDRRFMIRRALLRGKVSLRHPGVGAKEIGTSLLAVTGYSLALPFVLLLGHHRFMRMLVSLCDHLGRILECVGLNPIREAYLTE